MTDEEAVKRGRPKTHDTQPIIEKILEYKAEIVQDKITKKIAPKSYPVWEKIADETGRLKSAGALYTFVLCNRDNVRTLLTDDGSPQSNENDTSIENNSFDKSKATDTGDSSFNLSLEKNQGCVFMLRIPVSDFHDLLIKKVHILNANSKKTKKEQKCGVLREVYKMKPGIWEDFFSRRIWDETRSTCGYNFDYHYIAANRATGHIVGHCRCGSKIECYLQQNKEIMEIRCETTPGKKNLQCGKRYLRAPIRQEVAAELKHKSAYRYRIDEANKLMDEGDPEPAIIPSSAVLSTAKNELKKSKHIDSDPVKALHIMKYASSMKSDIQTISLDPFYVHYTTKHQNTLYRTMAEMEGTIIALDATGSIVRSLKKPDNSTSHPIFLYLIAAYNKKIGQMPVGQMLSEKHSTSIISFWLSEWLEQPGLPMPKEVVCDASRALLGAAVRAFTAFSTVNKYADACMETPPPSCYIRIDVAHEIKKYANFLKTLRPKVKQFYLACIGQLILSTNIKRSEKILQAILTIANSETEGFTDDGSVNPCETQKNIISDILTKSDSEIPVDEGEEDTTEEPEDNQCADPFDKNRCYRWAMDISEKVKQDIENQDGSRVNAHFFPSLTEKLVNDCQWLPLWSCIVQNNFGYGRIPASSVYVESEFKNIKHLLLKDETTPMRVDEFLSIHLQSLTGITKLKDSTVRSATGENGCQGDARNELLSDNDEQPVAHDEEPVDDEPWTNNDEQLTNAESRVNHDEQITNESRKYNGVQSTDNHEQPNILCPACLNNDKPNGAHKCMLCGISVHALPTCSIPCDADDEGYGQRRICLSCQKQSNGPRIIESKMFEDWRGLNTKSKRSSRYLREKYPANEFLLKEKLSKIPRFKNGSKIELKPIRKGKKKIDLSNTCAFDSIFQLFLTAAFDSNVFFQDVIEKNSSLVKFFALVKRVKKSGITSSAYKSRSEILCEIFEKHGNEKLSCYQLSCETTVASLCGKLLQLVGSFEETCFCSRGCSPRIIKLSTATISHDALMSESFNEQIEEEITLTGNSRTCAQGGCDGILRVDLKIPGNFVVLEVMARDLINDTNPQILLRNIPKTIQLSMMDSPYSLVGVIEFQSPNISTRNANFSLIGHYIPISYRNGVWVKFDSKEKNCSINYKSPLQVIVFAKMESVI